jgi:hypothetical protein
VFDDEDAEEVGVAASAEDVPREGGEAEGGDCGWMKEPKGVAPALGEECPEKDGTAAENCGGGAFCEDGETQEKAEEEGSKEG